MLSHESKGNASSSTGVVKSSGTAPVAGEEVDQQADENDDDENDTPIFKRFYRGIFKFFTYGVSQDAVAIRSRKVRKIHSKCVKYENRTEQLFSVMQLFTCSLASFSHGANDIANSTSPLAGKYSIIISLLLIIL